MRCKQAFTLIELMVVIAIIAALAAVLVPAVSGILEQARFVKCGANFSTLGKSLVMYDKDQAGVFPTLVRTGDVSLLPASPELDQPPSDGKDPDGNPLTATDTWDDAGRATLGGCPMQQVWPLIVNGQVGLNAFKCPGDPGWRARTVELKYGWTKLTEFSYGIQWPFEGTVNPATGKIATRNKATPFGKKRESRLVVMADRNNGGKVGPGIQHSNHPDAGAMGVDAGGNVMLHDKAGDSKGGMNGNDIYVDDKKATGGDGRTMPQSTEDTVIVPFKSR